MRNLPSRLTYANVISTLCLFIVLGGGAYAANGGLAPNSVGTKQLKNGAVTGAKIKKATIDTSKLTPAALASLSAPGPAGPAGQQGAQGPRGADGAPGAPGAPGQPGTTNAGAFATINNEDVVFVGAHPGFSAVERPGPEGVYCLTPTPGTNVEHPVASVDFAGSGGSLAKFVEPSANGVVFNCDPGQLEVKTAELFTEETEPGVFKAVPFSSNSVAFTVFAPGIPPGA